MNYLFFYAGVLIVLLLVLYREARQHTKNLGRLSLRIHVNGTRGKSGVTRLIAAGLRNGGKRVFAKTTGTEARKVLPDGSEMSLKRRGPANIRENIGLVREAASLGADTLVFECMALQPDLQKFCEQRLLKSHIGVITNVRSDHEDIMGKGLKNIAAALSNTIPEQGLLVTTRAAAPLLEPHLRGTQMFIADETVLPAEALQGFPYEVVPENLALALKVCELAGVPQELALAGMRSAAPDPGNLHLTHLDVAGKKIRLVDALAANDPDSTLWLWHRYVPAQIPAVVFLNCRPDRKLRTVQLCRAFTEQVGAGAAFTGRQAELPAGTNSVIAYIVTGDTVFAREILGRQGVPADKVFALPGTATFAELTAVLAQLSGRELTVFAAGNIKGLSQDFRNSLNGG